MKLDFEQLKFVADSFHARFVEAGDTFEQLDKGSMVYSINFDPQDGACRVHVQWPYFRNLVATASDHPATYDVVQSDAGDETWIYWTCHVIGVKVYACMDKSTVLDELKSLELPKDYEICEDDDIETLLKLWMNMSGWNMPCP